jgi:hypothetical protein
MKKTQDERGYYHLHSEVIGNFDFYSPLRTTDHVRDHSLTREILETVLDVEDTDEIAFVYKGSSMRLYLDPNELYCEDLDLASECILEIEDRFKYITNFEAPKQWK